MASAGENVFASSVGGLNKYDGVLTPFTYKLYDANMNAKCSCDQGYEGPDCSLRTCPTGDDPLTVTRAACGNRDCVNEVQGFTINGAATNDGLTYRIVFYDFYMKAYQTAPFVIKTATMTSAKHLANAAAVKAALEGLAGAPAGNVTVTSQSDLAEIGSVGSGIFNVRITVNFYTLSGNLPEFLVVPVTGGPVVTQASAVVHVFTLPSVAGSLSSWAANAISFQAFPDSYAGFRTAEFTTTTPTSTSGATYTNLIATALTALQGTQVAPLVNRGVSAFIYKFGSTAISVAASGPGSGVAGSTYLIVTLPSNIFGRNAMKLTIAGGTPASVTSTVDTMDGNKEAVQCANRGVCNSATGTCMCFPGYTSPNCAVQSALAQ